MSLTGDTMFTDAREAIARKRWEAQNYRNTGGYFRAAELEGEATAMEVAAGLPLGSVKAGVPNTTPPASKPGAEGQMSLFA